MKALVYEGVERVAFREVPEPGLIEGEHLIKVEAVGICGSDMHAFLGHDERRPAPLILGHEAAGVIVGGPKVGTRVTINPLVTPLDCPTYKVGRENLSPNRQIISMPPREGAFAQYVSMPERNLVEVPDGVSLDQAALAEPLAVSWHAARLANEALHASMEHRALVIGGGAIGLAASLALRAMGFENVIISEPNDARRAYLRDNCGQDVCAKVEESFPLVIDAVGFAATREIASDLVEPGGVIVHVGLGEPKGGLDIRRITLQEVTFIGSYTYTMRDFRDTAQAIFDGRLGSLNWIELRRLEDGQAAFEDLLSQRVAAPKIVFRPWD
ncbi:MAG: alcohol dehydrogenase catalytic domain-containing protein [Pseudomonadota bacterium]